MFEQTIIVRLSGCGEDATSVREAFLELGLEVPKFEEAKSATDLEFQIDSVLCVLYSDGVKSFTKREKAILRALKDYFTSVGRVVMNEILMNKRTAKE